LTGGETLAWGEKKKKRVKKAVRLFWKPGTSHKECARGGGKIKRRSRTGKPTSKREEKRKKAERGVAIMRSSSTVKGGSRGRSGVPGLQRQKKAGAKNVFRRLEGRDRKGSGKKKK